MLVLSRKVGERVVIDGRVTVVVTRVVGNRVTLGIEAPSDVHVLRGELQGEARGSEARGSEGGVASGTPLLPEVAGRSAPLAAMTSAVLAAHAAAQSAATSP